MEWAYQTVTLTLKQSEVYDIVEGITATIGKKNPDVSFENLWASSDDESPLSLFWDEAKNELNNTLQPWLTGYSESDGTLKIGVNVSVDWNDSLSTLLQDTCRQYMAHAIVAGWLGQIPSLSIGIDYTQTAADDLVNITRIITRKVLDFDEYSRTSDSKSRDDDDDVVSAGARHQDIGEEDDDYKLEMHARHSYRDQEFNYIEHETLNMSGVIIGGQRVRRLW